LCILNVEKIILGVFEYIEGLDAQILIYVEVFSLEVTGQHEL